MPELNAYILLTITAALTGSSLQGTLIGAKYRKQSGVKYPFQYATEEQCKNNSAAFRFNCAQRCHANYIENLLPMIGSMVIAGMKHSRLATFLGCIWLVARVHYWFRYLGMRYEAVGGDGKVPQGFNPVPWWIAHWGLHCLAFDSVWKLIRV